ncbi:MAG: RHS repeat protein, partial [Deltaproteobacteria bacterium]|nr:RHS repeat protein [Deltaproteobacteria bacterium]
MDKTDLVLPGILPIAIARTYRTQLTNAGPFGLGTSWPYDIFIQPPPNGSPDTLILFTPGNRQDLFARQPDGSFLNSTSPALRGGVVTVAGGVRSLRFKDGSLWRFDTAGRLINQADRNGNVLTLIRDGQGRVTGITDPSGRQLTIFYTGANLQIDRIQDPIGREVRYGYDASGRLINVTDAAGGITRYTYDSGHRMASITDPRGITFLANVYDSAGRVIRQTQADGGIWTFAYTTTGTFISQTTVTDPRGNSTTYRFNAAGYLISQTDAVGQTTAFDRQPGTNLLVVTTDTLGRAVRFTYDASGNATSIADPAGNVRRFEYEPTFNKLTKITDPLGN